MAHLDASFRETGSCSTAMSLHDLRLIVVEPIRSCQMQPANQLIFVTRGQEEEEASDDDGEEE